MKIKEVPSLSLGARNRKNPKRSGRPVPKARKCSRTAEQLRIRRVMLGRACQKEHSQTTGVT